MSLTREIAPNRDALAMALGVDPAVLDALLRLQGRPDLVSSAVVTKPLGEVIRLYMSAHLADPTSGGGSADTYKAYAGLLASFEQFMAQRWSTLPRSSWTIDRVTPADVEDFVGRKLLTGAARNARSSNRDKSILSSLFKWARKHKYLQWNPAADVSRVPEPKLMPVALSAKEQERLLDLSRQTKSGLRNHSIIHLVLNTGLRAAEVSNLRLEHLHLDEGWVHVEKGKGSKDRSVPLRPIVVESLRYYWEACRRHQIAAPGCEDAVFISTKGTQWGHPLTVDALEDMLKPLLIKIGRPKGNMHVLRHSFAVNLLRRGVHIAVISALLGHESFETTRKYLRLGDPEIANEIAGYFPEGVVVPLTMRDLNLNELQEAIEHVYDGA